MSPRRLEHNVVKYKVLDHKVFDFGVQKMHHVGGTR